MTTTAKTADKSDTKTDADKVKADSVNEPVGDFEAPEPEVEQVGTTDLYNANDGIHGRDGGPYLDQVEQLHWERHHAAREGNKPDLKNPRPYPGIVLRTASEQVANYNPLLIAGDDRRDNSDFTAKPVVTDHPVLAPVVKDGDPLGDQPLTDDPTEQNISAEVEKFTLGD
jgi:hypothetical protein